MTHRRRRATLRGVIVLSSLAVLGGCVDREVSVHERPVHVVDDAVGMGNAAKPGDIVTIRYRITTLDGRELQRMDRYTFQAGAGTVVQGMDEAVLGMRRGGRRIVEVPPHKHWGRQGFGEGPNAIPPAARLLFDVEMLRIERSSLSRR